MSRKKVKPKRLKPKIVKSSVFKRIHHSTVAFSKGISTKIRNLKPDKKEESNKNADPKKEVFRMAIADLRKTADQLERLI